MTEKQVQIIKNSFEKTEDSLALLRTVQETMDSPDLETAISELEDVSSNLDDLVRESIIEYIVAKE